MKPLKRLILSISVVLFATFCVLWVCMAWVIAFPVWIATGKNIYVALAAISDAMAKKIDNGFLAIDK